MNINLKLSLIILLILQLVLIINRVKRKKMTMKYASFWILLIIIMSIVVIFPGIVFKLSNIAGFEEASNMIFLLGFFFLFYVSFNNDTSWINVLIFSFCIDILVVIIKESVEKNGKKD